MFMLSTQGIQPQFPWQQIGFPTPTQAQLDSTHLPD